MALTTHHGGGVTAYSVQEGAVIEIYQGDAAIAVYPESLISILWMHCPDDLLRKAGVVVD